jgi:hypothetical protein
MFVSICCREIADAQKLSHGNQVVGSVWLFPSLLSAVLLLLACLFWLGGYSAVYISGRNLGKHCLCMLLVLILCV